MRNCVCTLPPPSTISRRTPRVAEVLGELAHLDPLATVDDGRHGSEPRAGVDDARTRAVDELLGRAGGEEVGARVQFHAVGHGHLDRRRQAVPEPCAPRDGPGSARAAADCRCARCSLRPGSRRTRPAPRRRGRSRHGLTARVAAVRRCRDSRRSTCHSSAGCTGGQAWAAPSRSGGAFRTGSRVRRNHATTRTTAPGRLATSTITP